MNFQARLERLEKLVAKQRAVWPPVQPEPAMTDEQLTEAIHRFLAGESLEAIARSQGWPWHPSEPLPDGMEVSEEVLREGIRRLLEETGDGAEEPDASFDPSGRDDDEGDVPSLEGIGDGSW